MNDRTILTSLRPHEWDVVCRLRDLPAGRLKTQVLDLVAELLRFAAEPSCSGQQADGVPCASAHTSCDECQQVAACVTRLRGLLVAAPAEDLA